MNPKIATNLTVCFLFLLIIQLVFVQADMNLENYKSSENSNFTKYTLIKPSTSIFKCSNEAVTDLYIITHTSSDVAHLVPSGLGYIPADLDKVLDRFMTVSGFKKVTEGRRRSWNVQERSCKRSRTANGCNAERSGTPRNVRAGT